MEGSPTAHQSISRRDFIISAGKLAAAGVASKVIGSLTGEDVVIAHAEAPEDNKKSIFIPSIVACRILYGADMPPHDDLPEINKPDAEVVDFVEKHSFDRGDTTKDNVMQTFDDFFESPKSAEAFLDKLKAAGVKSTFFILADRLASMLITQEQLNAYKAKYHEEANFTHQKDMGAHGWTIEKMKSIFQRMIDEGHEIGSHAYQHERELDDFDKPEHVERELSMSLHALYQFLPKGYQVKLFRAPGGGVIDRPWVKNVAAKLGLQHVAWGPTSGNDMDPYAFDDGKFVKMVINRLIDAGIRGAILLQHMNRFYDLKNSDWLADTLHKAGIKTCTVSDGMNESDKRPEKKLPEKPKDEHRPIWDPRRVDVV